MTLDELREKITDLVQGCGLDPDEVINVLEDISCDIEN